MQLDEDLLQVAAQNATLRSCAIETRAALFQCGKVQSYEPGEKVWVQGEPANVAVFPLKGKFQLTKTASTGRKQVFCYLEPGGCTNMCMFLLADHSLSDIVTVEAGQLLIVPGDAVVQLTTQDSSLAREAWGSMTHCLGHFVNMVENLSFHKVSERVALALTDATARNTTTVRLTQAELAAEVGTTREVVARCLADFQAAGAIRLGRGRIMVLNREQLLSVAS